MKPQATGVYKAFETEEDFEAYYKTLHPRARVDLPEGTDFPILAEVMIGFRIMPVQDINAMNLAMEELINSMEEAEPERKCPHCESTDLVKEKMATARDISEPDSISTIPTLEPRYVCKACGKEIRILEEDHKWCVSQNEEMFHDRFDTSDEAIEFGRKEYGPVFFIGKCRDVEKRDLYPDADEICESIINRAADNHGECAEDYDVELPGNAMTEIGLILDRYIADPTFWIVWDVKKFDASDDNG